MKTDDLIAALAVDLPPVRRGRLRRTLALVAAAAAAPVLAAVWFVLGPRPDLAEAVGSGVFLAKAAYMATLGLVGFWLMDRLGRPGASARRPLGLLAAVLVAAGAAGAIELAAAAPGGHAAVVLGGSAAFCPPAILALSLLALPFILVAARRFAPPDPLKAGAAAGLLAAGLAGTLYGLHCPERTAAFVAVWYTLGAALAAAAGAAAGRFLLRW